MRYAFIVLRNQSYDRLLGELHVAGLTEREEDAAAMALSNQRYYPMTFACPIEDILTEFGVQSGLPLMEAIARIAA